MKIEVREDKVTIEGYVNAVERVSKPLWSRVGQFLERIMAGAFSRAIKRNDDIHILLNHDWNRNLGSTKEGTLELKEDNIGLHARAEITDADVIKKARNGDLVGWSFGFSDIDVDNSTEKGFPLREVKDLNLYEVSILDRTKTPAYNGTLIEARSEEEPMLYRGEDNLEEVEVIEEVEVVEEVIEEVVEEAQEEQREEVQEEVQEPKQQEIVEENKPVEVDYSIYDAEITKMKGD